MVANIKEIDIKASVFLNGISRVQHGKVKNVPVCTQGSFLFVSRTLRGFRVRRDIFLVWSVGIRSPDSPARSESLYRLSYTGPQISL